MAGGVNGTDGADQPRAGRAVRVTAAPGSGPEGQPERTLVEIDARGILRVDGQRRSSTLTDVAPPRARLETDDGSHRVLVHELRDIRRASLGVRRLEVVVDGWRFELDVESEARARLRERATSERDEAARGGPSELRAIIPGRVVSVDVAEGDVVETGRRLLVLEAMKMQNELKAPRAGTVLRVAVGPGATVELGDVLLVLE